MGRGREVKNEKRKAKMNKETRKGEVNEKGQ